MHKPQHIRSLSDIVYYTVNINWHLIFVCYTVYIPLCLPECTEDVTVQDHWNQHFCLRRNTSFLK